MLFCFKFQELKKTLCPSSVLYCNERLSHLVMLYVGNGTGMLKASKDGTGCGDNIQSDVIAMTRAM